MNKFAKLFEYEGKQIVVMKGTNEDGDSAVCICFEADIGYLDIKIAFSEGKEDKLDAFLESVDCAKAVAMIESMVDRFDIKWEQE